MVFFALLAKAQQRPFYCFDFEMDSIPLEQRTKMMVEIGYSGVTFAMKNDKQIEKYYQYLATKEAKAGKFSIPIVYFPFHFDAHTENEEKLYKRVFSVPTLKAVWVILVNNEMDISMEQGLTVLEKMADEAARQGKDLVIYPHDRTLIESVEEALPYIEIMKRPNVYVSMHSCHEMRAGNGERMLEVTKKAKPYLKFASIAGSDKTMNSAPEAGDWKDAIKPLDRGDYDIRKFVYALDEIGYKGEVFLHTFGLEDEPHDHLTRSIECWNKINSKPYSE